MVETFTKMRHIKTVPTYDVIGFKMQLKHFSHSRELCSCIPKFEETTPTVLVICKSQILHIKHMTLA